MEYTKALAKCMNICSRAENCIYDLQQKMIRWEVGEDDQQKVLDKLVQDGFVNHERYVRAYVNDKIRYNYWGKVKVRYQLRMKQLESHLVEDYFEQFPQDEYEKIARYQVQKKLKSTKGNSNYEIKQKAARSIVAKGFEPSLVFSILDEELKE